MKKGKYLVVGIISLCLLGVGIIMLFNRSFEKVTYGRLTDENTADTMQNALQKKYGKKFVVEDVKSPASIYLRDENPKYTATAYVEGKREDIFQVAVSKKSKQLTDTYGKLIYEQLIKERLNHILEPQINFEKYSYDIIYELTAGKWTEESQLEEYLKESGTYISCDITIADRIDKTEAAKNLESIFKAFYFEQMYFNCAVHLEGHFYGFCYFEGDEKIHYDTICKKLHIA